MFLNGRNDFPTQLSNISTDVFNAGKSRGKGVVHLRVDGAVRCGEFGEVGIFDAGEVGADVGGCLGQEVR